MVYYCHCWCILLLWIYLPLHIITKNVPAGAYYYHECTCWCILLLWLYLLVHIITMNVLAGAFYYSEYTCWFILLPWMYLLVHIITVNVPAGAYYYHECTCWCILLPWMYLLVHIPQTCSTAVKPTEDYPTEKILRSSRVIQYKKIIPYDMQINYITLHILVHCHFNMIPHLKEPPA